MKIFEENKVQYGSWIIGVYAAFVVLFVLLSILFPGGLRPLGINLGWPVILLVTLLLYTSLSLNKVPADKQASLQIFGRPLLNLHSGLVFVPWLIANIRIETKTKILMDFGTPERDDDGNIVRHPDEDSSEMVRLNDPLRITTKDGERDSEGAYKSPDPLERRQTIDPHIVVIMQIDAMIQFIQQVGGVKKAARYVFETVRSILQEYNGKYTAAEMLLRNAELSRRMRKAIERLVGDVDAYERYEKAEEDEFEDGITEEEKAEDLTKPGLPWGVDLQEVRLSSLGLPKDVNVAMASNVAAGFEAQRVTTLAEAERVKRRKEGQGDGEGEEARITGRANGRRQLAKAVTASRTGAGKLVAEQETARETLGPNSKVVVTDSKLLNAVAGGAAALKEVTEKDED